MMAFDQLTLKSRNIFLVYASLIAGGMLFFLPILALYFEETLFTVTNVALIFAVEAIAMVIFEVPTGAIADLFGRKRTLVLANLVVLLGGGISLYWRAHVNVCFICNIQFFSTGIIKRYI